MQFDNPVKIAFIISVFFHSFLFFALPAINVFLPKKPAKQFEINYYRFKEYQPAPETARQITKSPDRQKETIKVQPAKQQQPKENAASEAKKDLVVPPVPKAVQRSPAYLDYAQSVREKIDRIAHHRYQRIYSGGEALVNFVLLSDGSLSVIKVVDERSTADEGLKKTAQAIIEDSAPFAPFPSDLEFKQLSFGVTISFE